MTIKNHPFEKLVGSDRIKTPFFLGLILIFLVFLAASIGKLGLMGGIVLFLLPFISVYVYLLLKYPIIGLYTAEILAFFLLGLGRYIRGIPIGLVMDGMLVGTYLALFFNRFHEKVDWTPAKKDITVLATIWFGYSLFQVVNPEANSFAAWFSGRGIGFYMFLIIPLTLLFFDNQKKLDLFLIIWGVCSLLVTLKGIMQVKMGVDFAEQAWLDEGNYKTHILFGQLRAFSFLSDAGQFGANQAYSGLVAILLAFNEKSWKKKLFFGIVGMLGFYGLVISGTRGAISVPITGLGLYVVLRKNKTLMISGFVMLLLIFYFFKFTTIGQGNYQIRRMRTAFDPNDASLQVRLENQRRLKSYMASRPFGGGIGHGGVKAQRFLPNAYLSQVPTDSWYVLVWVEQGIVGLLLHLFILFYILGKSSFQIMFRIRDPILKIKLSAVAAGLFGIMVASYGNAVLGQMPTSILVYISMGLLMNSKTLEENKNPDKIL